VKLAVITVAVLLALGAGGHFGWTEFQKQQDARARYDETVGKLELLVADLYVPPDRSPEATETLQQHGCKPEWTQAPKSAATRLAEAEKLATADPALLARLRADESSPTASYVLAMLLLETPVAQRPELAGVDPEVLLRRAAGKGHGHASFYFARLLAEKYPHTAEPKDEADASTFFDINKRLEQAADAGSGGAAYLLGFRTQAEVIAKFAEAEKERNRRAAPTSRTPREWWCRAAQLGHPPGQLQCYRVGKRRAEEAKQLLVDAANGGHEGASALLAELHARGQGGFPQDGAKQKELLCRAVAFGDKRSVAALGRFEKAQARAAQLRAAQEERALKAAARAAKRSAAPNKASSDKAKAPTQAQSVAKPKKKLPAKAKLTH
jgi:hypothetical protein